MNFLQRLGKSMMLPITVLPICGILMGLGYILCPVSAQGGDITGVAQGIGYFLVKAGGAIIDNMSILFVIGVALGMSGENSGIACLAGLAGWLTVTVLLSNKVITGMLTGFMASDIKDAAFSEIQNPFIGILCGLMGAICYNRFKNTRLPNSFAFFSGKRFVVIATVLVSLVMAIALAFIWPFVFGGLYYVGNILKDMGGVGAGIYAFLNRLLIPTGLHHALNNVFWFDTIGIGDLTNYWAGKTSADVGYSLGCYMSGFFPCIMFGIPGAALAIYQKSGNRKKAGAVLIPCVICAFVCGLTEPFEFLFLFLAFPLYIIYSIFYGIVTVITYYSGFRAGFSFSAGAIDLTLSASLPAAAKTWMLIILGIGSFFLFYIIFRIYLSRSKLVLFADEENGTGDISGIRASAAGENRFSATALAMLASVGGAGNVISAECCATRLRLELKDAALVDKEGVKKAGAIGVFLKGTACQIVIGVTVQQVHDEFKRLLDAPVTANVSPARGTGKNPPGIKVTHGQMICLGHNAFAYTVKAPSGLHARPAGRIVKLMQGSGATGRITLGEKSASATSITELMSLGIRQGDTILVSTGNKKVLQKMKELLEEIL